MRKKKDTVLTEAIASMNYLVRHRGGIKIGNKRLDQLNSPKFLNPLLGKKTLYLDNQVPALIQDAFNNLGYEQKDGQKPVIAAKRKTEYGWHLVWQLPPGISFKDVKRDLDYFKDAANAWVDLEWKQGKCHMDVHHGSLATIIPYAWDPADYKNFYLPIPIGYSLCGLEMVDLPLVPHLLVSGATNNGKSNLLHVIALSALRAGAIVVVIDHKRLDFGYLQDICLLARRETETLMVLESLNQEFERRVDLLEMARKVKIQDYEGKMPYIVVIIDELAEVVGNDKAMFYIDRLVRLARAVGISIIPATQRTSTKILPGDTRNNFVARVCYLVGSETDSRVVLGENCPEAAWLPAVKGRCVFKYGMIQREVQSMYLPMEQAHQLADQIRKEALAERWEVNVNQSHREPPTKRLKAK